MYTQYTWIYDAGIYTYINVMCASASIISTQTHIKLIVKLQKILSFCRAFTIIIAEEWERDVYEEKESDLNDMCYIPLYMHTIICTKNCIIFSSSHIT